VPIYEPVIGLEVHAELLTESKMFCGCPVVETVQAEPNTAVCMVCTGMPGALPVANRRAVEYTILVGLALDCTIAEYTFWERKSYFYPDLPKNYQISQYQNPLCFDGALTIETPAGPRRIGIRRAHLEEDTGKLFHLPDGNGAAGGATSLVDFNRAGVPLLEIVTAPELHSVDEVKACATELRTILRYLGVNSGDMEKGVIRFEANVSLREAGSTVLNPRTEVKNLNSFRALVRAVEHEIARQSALYARGERVAQQTLGWNEVHGVTYPQRSKEEAQDYRYFPEPDLPPLEVAADWVAELRAGLPELPAAKRARFIQAYGLSVYDVRVLTAERAVADWYEEAVAAGAGRASPKAIANWTTGEVFRLLRDSGRALATGEDGGREDGAREIGAREIGGREIGAREIGALRVTPAGLAELVALVEAGQVSAASAKDVLDEMAATGEAAPGIVAARGLAQISDRGALEALVEQVLADNPGPVNDYLDGKEPILRFLIGQVMKASRGQANPALVQQVLLERLAQLRDS
jgi:aspartyl-tRNA(Asn)/glutamyl-tRNA(Gln) amidotransferase subunit B